MDVSRGEFAGGARAARAGGQPGRRRAVPPRHRAPPGERRGVLAAALRLPSHDPQPR